MLFYQSIEGNDSIPFLNHWLQRLVDCEYRTADPCNHNSKSSRLHSKNIQDTTPIPSHSGIPITLLATLKSPNLLIALGTSFDEPPRYPELSMLLHDTPPCPLSLLQSGLQIFGMINFTVLISSLI